jgi:hypothetical protein
LRPPGTLWLNPSPVREMRARDEKQARQVFSLQGWRASRLEVRRAALEVKERELEEMCRSLRQQSRRLRRGTAQVEQREAALRQREQDQAGREEASRAQGRELGEYLKHARTRARDQDARTAADRSLRRLAP